MGCGPDCPLCLEGSVRRFAEYLNRGYYLCEECGGVFLDPADRLTPEQERARYLHHTNDVTDPGYRRFVSPLVEAIRERISADENGLDYGAGPGPVVSTLLREAGYHLTLYDPFFHYYPEVLNQRYGFIVCCEVMEHFHHPLEEFRRLKNCLQEGGSLFCMTERYDGAVPFGTWHYKNDPTHVFFYHEKSLEWIRQQVGFRRLVIQGRVIVFDC